MHSDGTSLLKMGPYTLDPAEHGHYEGQRCKQRQLHDVGEITNPFENQLSLKRKSNWQLFGVTTYSSGLILIGLHLCLLPTESTGGQTKYFK